MTRVYHARKFTFANVRAVSDALKRDAYLAAIVDSCLMVDARLDRAAKLVVDELKRRGHHRTPCGMSCYSFHSVRRALAGRGK
jgi:hypothetical protein